MKKNAKAVRGFTLNGNEIAKDEILLDMAANQFADLESVGLVTQASVAEIAAVKKATEPEKPAQA